MNSLRGVPSPNSVSTTAQASPAEGSVEFNGQRQNRAQNKCGQDSRFSLRGILRNIIPIIFCCLFVDAASFAHGQSTFGSVRGTVQDATGANIPDAQVVLHSTDENTDHKGTSDASGSFIFENVKSGNYSLRAQHDGFADASLTGIALAPRQDLRLVVLLSLAQQSTTVEVTSSGAQVNTENATIGDTISNQDLTQLPLNSRAVSSSPLAGLALSASVVQDSQGNIAVSGAPAAMVGFSVDGISTANVRSNGALHDAYPSSEGISETKVTAFNNNAEFAQVGDVTFSSARSWSPSLRDRTKRI